MESEKAFHLKIKKGDIGRYAILPGDPARCKIIAKHFDSPELLSQNREFTIYTGTLAGERVCVCSTGIGGPSSAIAVEELFACGADTFIRVGTCGGINPKVVAGDCVVATAAVRQDGTSREYAPYEFPAVADTDIVCALRSALAAEGFPCHLGIVQSKDSFYGQHSPERMPVSYELTEKWECWKRLGVLASEMESATQFVVSSALGARCGGVFSVVWNQEREKLGFREEKVESSERAVIAAVRAIELLIKQDGQRA